MRYYGLDIARAWLMLMGIAYHAALIYTPHDQPLWRVASTQTHPLFAEMAQFIHDFRMQAFYIISGFFFSMLIGKSGPLPALGNRWVKLGIPMVFCGLTINTVMNLLSTEWQFHLGSHADISTYLLRGEWLGHLWFLGNLLVYCCAGILIDPLARQIRRLQQPQFSSALLLIGATVLTGVLLAHLGHRLTSTVWLFVTPDALFMYLPFFVLGMLLWHNKNLFTLLTDWHLTLPLLLAAMLLMQMDSKMGLATRSYSVDQLIRMFYSLTLALFVLSLFGLIRRPSRLAGRLSAASYTIYLLHQPLVVLLFGVAKLLALPPLAGFLLICSATGLLSYLVHVLVVERSGLAAFLLNGKTPDHHHPGSQTAVAT
jgi:surface polysaccharide O-acyltransferase-like enzyme